MLLVLLSTFFTATGQVFFKKASGRIGFDIVGLATNYALFTGFLLYGAGAVLLIMALKHGELSVLYPIYATNFIWVSLLSPMFFDDSMNLYKWLGVFVVLIGITFVALGSKK